MELLTGLWLGMPVWVWLAFLGAVLAILVVMGSHGHGALTGLLLGSTVSAVLSLSKVPLLIVR